MYYEYAYGDKQNGLNKNPDVLQRSEWGIYNEMAGLLTDDVITAHCHHDSPLYSPLGLTVSQNDS